MKSIEELEDLRIEDLEKMAQDSSICVPEDMGAKVESALIAAAAHKAAKARAWKYAGVLSLAAAATAAVLVLGNPSQPKDTFSDPLLAYAEIEKTFSYISHKAETAFEAADEAAPVIEKTINRLK